MKTNKGITLIALVVTIVVLLILAGVSISMLTGENGIITQAQKSKIQTEIGKEKEYITLSVSAVKGDKISKGDTSEITSSELQIEMNKYTDEATVTGRGTLTVTYESGRSYEVDQDGSITEKEDLTLEEAKKIVYVTGCMEAILVETLDGTVYYVDNLQEEVMQKIEITDAEVITTNGIKEAGDGYFLDKKGKVYTWGFDNYGELGSIYADGYIPTCISDIPGNALNGKNIVKISSNGKTVIALDDEGKVYTWGRNNYGQLGNGTIDNSSEVICISDIEGNIFNGKNIIEIQSENTMIALDNEGKVYTWGENSNGSLGNGTDYENSSEPICISDIEENILNRKNIIKIQSENNTMVVLDNEGKVYTWGNNIYGELGNGTDENRNIPVCISDISKNVLNKKNIVEILRGPNMMIAIDDKGKVYTWGANYNGQLGNGTDIEYSNEPICISDLTGNVLNGKNIIEIQYGIALDSEGKVYTWGANYNGQLGNGTDIEYSNEPICISDIEENALKGKNIVKVLNFSTMIALDNEGKIYVWGKNVGQFGNGTIKEYNEPICITDIEENELYNKKIKFINMSNSIGNNFFSYITEEGDLYNYFVFAPIG